MVGKRAPFKPIYHFTGTKKQDKKVENQWLIGCYVTRNCNEKKYSTARYPGYPDSLKRILDYPGSLKTSKLETLLIHPLKSSCISRLRVFLIFELLTMVIIGPRQKDRIGIEILLV